MKKFVALLTISGILILASACDRAVCENTNPVFDHYAPDTREYKAELAKRFATADRSELSYWMDTYHEDDSLKTILAHVQGDGLCAKILLVVGNYDRGIEDLIQKKGMGYRGAELEDLEFDIVQDSVTTAFVFKGISGIID